MIRDPASNRYAQAAFELALEHDELEAWERDLQSLALALASEEAQAFVASRQIAAGPKEEFLRRASGEPVRLVWNLVRLLALRGRLPLLPQIAERFQTLLDEHRGIAHAHVLTATRLGDDERQALERSLSELTGKQVLVDAYEAPEILGGLVARISDQLIDGSVRSKLLALERQLAGVTR
ncbi:MAG: ATP synthase F1 subunit delta [Chloroflexi bacterium]|nr:ATP synthase F1 subunit delta [Chloroflexota bacterium]